MTMKDNDTKPKKKTNRPRKKKAKQKKSEKQPYAGTHGYTEEEVEEIVKEKKGRDK